MGLRFAKGDKIRKGVASGVGVGPFPQLLRLNGTSRLSQTYWVLIPAPPLLGCVMFGKLEDFSVLHFLACKKGRERVLPGVWTREHCLGHSKCSRGPSGSYCHQSVHRAGLARYKFSRPHHLGRPSSWAQGFL